MSHTSNDHPNVSIVVLGYYSKGQSFGVFHKATRTMTYFNSGTLDVDPEASTITRDGKYLFISSREKKLGAYSVPLDHLTSVDQPQQEQQPDNSTNLSVESTEQIAIPGGATSVAVYALNGAQVARIELADNGAVHLPALNLNSGLYAFVFTCTAKVDVQLVHIDH